MSYLRRSLEAESERETCIIPFFLTSSSQRQVFSDYVRNNSLCDGLLPIFWQVEVADERNGWFPGTTVNYRIDSHSLEVHVSEGTGRVCYHGFIDCDFLVVRLIRCSDNYSKALFNLIVRESVLPVRWEVDWLEADNFLSNHSLTGKKNYKFQNHSRLSSTDSELSTCIRIPRSPALEDGPQVKRWFRSMAYYYIRAINVLVLEDYSARDTRGIPPSYLLLPVTENLCLHQCFDFHSLREFRRLIVEEKIPCSHGPRFQIQQPQPERHRPGRGNLLPYAPEYRPFIDRCKSARLIHERDDSSSYIIAEPTQASKSDCCVICLEKEICNIAFIPCGHQVICETCFHDCFPDHIHSESSSSTSITNPSHHRSLPRRTRIFDCPICRNSIHSYLKIYRV